MNTTKSYAGTPTDIMQRVCKEITEVLTTGGVAPVGMTALALIHIGVSVIRNHDALDNKMPSYGTVVSLMTRAFYGEKLTHEEEDQFNKEFISMVESLGGYQVKPGTNAPWLVPHGGIH